MEGSSPGYSFSLELKGSRTLVIDNLASGAGNTLQHRNGFFCDFVGNLVTASGGGLAYGHGDLWVDNEMTSDGMLVKMGNYDQVDWVGLGSPPQSGTAPDRYTTFYDRYAHQFANDLARENMPSPRPACSQTLFIGNNFPKGTAVGQADTSDVASVTSTVRSRARPARNCLIQNHAGPITLISASYTIPGVAAAYVGPWPAQQGTVDKRNDPRPTVYPAGYRNAGAAFPPAYVPILLSTANCGATAA